MASATNNEGGFYHQEQILADVEAIEDQDDSIDLEYRGWQTERVSQRLRKAVALTLLLYAFLDVCVPGFCPFQMPVLSLERSAAHYSTVAAAKEPGDRPSPLDNDDEGCFCCSNRVIAVAHNFQFGDLPVDVIEFEAVPQQASLSIAPPHQPPRI